MVKAEDSQLSGCGLEPWHRILDGSVAVTYNWKNNENKGNQRGHTKKNDKEYKGKKSLQCV